MSHPKPLECWQKKCPAHTQTHTHTPDSRLQGSQRHLDVVSKRNDSGTLSFLHTVLQSVTNLHTGLRYPLPTRIFLHRQGIELRHTRSALIPTILVRKSYTADTAHHFHSVLRKTLRIFSQDSCTMQQIAGCSPPVIHKTLQFTQLHRLTQFTTIIFRTI